MSTSWPAAPAILDSQVNGETKGVVQLKGNVARKHSALGKRCQGLVQVNTAVVERRGEALLLGGDDTLDEGDVLEQLGISLAHLSVDFVDELGQEGALDAQQATVEHGTTEQAAKDVLATLVTGKDAVEIMKSTAREWSAMMRRERLAPE